MATSILAGLFVLISQRFITFAPLLKLLLAVWIVQNIFLVSSAFARLELYVDVYGLTYLRVRAGIGMGLVVVGMALLAWQLWFSKSNSWVTSVFAGVCAATLYAGCFVNFGYVIARVNLVREAGRIDTSYLCRNTTLAVSALLEHAKTTSRVYCGDAAQYQLIAPEGWRDWGLRDTRLAAAQQKFLMLNTRDSVTSTQPRITSGDEEIAR
ncbi:DUF4173 domain-containing protein [Pseudophaeobacter leonis]|uniref:DUF4153 domain-containing protein n=1 Tax=Pseudophaeobacter leonis TaxID=1144477 RepID=UPI001F4E432A|nr:DUF4173 domain-containing protein [Pseudophaeobacter leonis]